MEERGLMVLVANQVLPLSVIPGNPCDKEVGGTHVGITDRMLFHSHGDGGWVICV